MATSLVDHTKMQYLLVYLNNKNYTKSTRNPYLKKTLTQDKKIVFTMRAANDSSEQKDATKYKSCLMQLRDFMGFINLTLTGCLSKLNIVCLAPFASSHSKEALLDIKKIIEDAVSRNTQILRQSSLQNNTIETQRKKSRKNYSVDRMSVQQYGINPDIGEITNHTMLNSSNSEIELINGVPTHNDLQKQIDLLR